MQQLPTFILMLVLCWASAVEGRPNIVFILADDLGWGDVGWNNPSMADVTPHLTKLARWLLIFCIFFFLFLRAHSTSPSWQGGCHINCCLPTSSDYFLQIWHGALAILCPAGIGAKYHKRHTTGLYIGYALCMCLFAFFAYLQNVFKAGIRCVPQAGQLSSLASTPFTLDARSSS